MRPTEPHQKKNAVAADVLKEKQFPVKAATQPSASHADLGRCQRAIARVTNLSHFTPCARRTTFQLLVETRGPGARLPRPHRICQHSKYSEITAQGVQLKATVTKWKRNDPHAPCSIAASCGSNVGDHPLGLLRRAQHASYTSRHDVALRSPPGWAAQVSARAVTVGEINAATHPICTSDMHRVSIDGSTSLHRLRSCAAKIVKSAESLPRFAFLAAQLWRTLEHPLRLVLISAPTTPQI